MLKIVPVQTKLIFTIAAGKNWDLKIFQQYSWFLAWKNRIFLQPRRFTFFILLLSFRRSCNKDQCRANSYRFTIVPQDFKSIIHAAISKFYHIPSFVNHKLGKDFYFHTVTFRWNLNIHNYVRTIRTPSLDPIKALICSYFQRCVNLFDTNLPICKIQNKLKILLI